MRVTSGKITMLHHNSTYFGRKKVMRSRSGACYSRNEAGSWPARLQAPAWCGG